MKTAVAVVMGLLSGLLLYFMSFMLFVDIKEGGAPSPVLWLATLLGGWAVSAYLIRRNTRSVSRVFSRGFLLGAAEWLAMVAVGVVFSGRLVSNVTAGAPAGDGAAAGAALGGGMFAFLTGGVSVFMAVVCLIGFAVSYFMGREMKPEAPQPTKKCPMCAELVQAEARKCRYCGAEFTAA